MLSHAEAEEGRGLWCDDVGGGLKGIHLSIAPAM